ncbi:DNA polymerase alpha catalytic subunit [Bienertia sinuspersici]
MRRIGKSCDVIVVLLMMSLRRLGFKTKGEFLRSKEEDGHGHDKSDLVPNARPRVRVTDDNLIVAEKDNLKTDLGFVDDGLKQTEASGDEKQEKLSANVMEIDPTFKEDEENQTVSSFNTKMEEEKNSIIQEKPGFVLETDGSLPFYMLDAHVESHGCKGAEKANAGLVYLFGKVKAGNAYHSCCIAVKNMQRCLYAIPTSSVFRNELVLKLRRTLLITRFQLQNFATNFMLVFKSPSAMKLNPIPLLTFSYNNDELSFLLGSASGLKTEMQSIC